MKFVVAAEVVGFRDDRILLMPLGEIRGIGAGNRIEFQSHPAHLAISPLCLGRVLDGLGRAIDGGAPFPWTIKYPLYGEGLNPLDRKRITRPLDLGVRAINGLLTCGIGQKLGIFAGSGVGKSVLLGMLCRQTSADVNVIALIGERGREVKEFIDKELGPEGLKKSVVIAATSDQPPLVRLRGAFVATAIAEYFREQGKARVAAHGFSDSPRSCPAGNRLGCRRASHDERLPSLGVYGVAKTIRTSRTGCKRVRLRGSTPCW